MPKIEEELLTELEIEEPKKFKVLLHNDDYTTMDFVVEILMEVFHKSYEEAEFITLTIHTQEKAVCGIYSFEIAKMKVQEVKRRAKENEYPLLATMEKE